MERSLYCNVTMGTTEQGMDAQSIAGYKLDTHVEVDLQIMQMTVQFISLRN